MFFKSAIERVYTTAILAIFILIISIITIKFFIPNTILMYGEYPFPSKDYNLKEIVRVVVSTLLLFTFFLIYYRLVVIRLNRMVTTMVSTGYLLLILASEIIITSIALTPSLGDYASMKQGVVAFFEGKDFHHMGQFLMYPYNAHLLLIGGYFAKVLGSVDLSLKILPIISITGSIILNSLIVKKVTNFKVAHISIVMSFLNILIYWQAPVFYTHTLIVIFLPATMYAYLNLRIANTKGKKIFWWIALGLFAALTYIIRPTALSVSLAIVFENIFKYRKKQSMIVLSSVLACVLLIIGFNTVTNKLNLSTDNNTQKFPYSHWIKMGLNKQTYGFWNSPDCTYPPNSNTHDKDVYNKKIIIQRLKDYGVSGFMGHLNEKIEREWVSSQLSMYRIGEWYKQKNNTITNIVNNHQTISYKLFDLYSYVIKLFILLGVLTAAVFYRKLNENEMLVLRISMTSTIIVFVFLMMWETAEHYSYEAYAFLNIPASIGIYHLFNKIKTKKQEIECK